MLKETPTPLPLCPLISSAWTAVGLNLGHCSEKLASICSPHFVSIRKLLHSTGNYRNQWKSLVMYKPVLWALIMTTKLLRDFTWMLKVNSGSQAPGPQSSNLFNLALYLHLLFLSLRRIRVLKTLFSQQIIVVIIIWGSVWLKAIQLHAMKLISV